MQRAMVPIVVALADKISLVELIAERIERRFLHRVTNNRAVIEPDKGVGCGEGSGGFLTALSDIDQLQTI